MSDQQIERESTVAPLPTAGRALFTRRGLLAGAASGFALAASGLLLPADLAEEAAADNLPVHHVQRREEQRRRKRRNERRRSQGPRRSGTSHHHRKRKPGDFGMRGIQFEITVKGGPLPLEFYVHGDSINSLRRIDARTVEPGEPLALNTFESFAAVWIDNRYYFDAVNYLPPLDMKQRVGLWGRIDPQKGWISGTLKFSDDLYETERKIDESAPIMWDDLRYVHFLRRPDGPLYKDFSIFIQPR